MHPRHIVIAFLASVMIASQALSGCAGITQSATPINVQAAALLETRAKQALFGCELLFNGFSITVDAAVSSGQLTGANAARVQVAYRRAHDALLAARAAYTMGNYAAVVLRSQEVTTAVQALAPILARPAT